MPDNIALYFDILFINQVGTFILTFAFLELSEKRHKGSMKFWNYAQTDKIYLRKIIEEMYRLFFIHIRGMEKG